MASGASAADVQEALGLPEARVAEGHQGGFIAGAAEMRRVRRRAGLRMNFVEFDGNDQAAFEGI